MKLNELMKRLLSLMAAAVFTLLTVITPVGAASVTFTNGKEDQPDLYVHKRVTTSVEGYEAPEDDEFTFLLELNGEPAAQREYTLTDIGGNKLTNTVLGLTTPWKTDDNGQFTLKNGQTARFEFVGIGAGYHVTELPRDGYHTVMPAGGEISGTVNSEGSIVNFENEYLPSNPSNSFDGGESGTTHIAVTKALRYPYEYDIPHATAEAEFRFRITVRGEAYEEEFYTVTDAEGNVLSDELETDMNGEFTLKAGQTATFYHVEADGDYKVEELDMPTGWHQITASNAENAITQPRVSARFTNTNAAFTVSKVLRGEEGSTEEHDEERLNQDFTFVLKKGDGSLWEGAQYYLYTTGGDLLSEELNSTNNKGEFTLKSYQSALFINMEVGTEYSVSELPVSGYVQTLPTDHAGYTNKKVLNAVESLLFENHYENELLSLELFKHNKDGAPLSGVEFELFSDEDCTVHAAMRAVTDAEGNDTGETSTVYTTDSNGKVTIDGLPQGTYFLKEIKAANGYGLPDSPVKIVLDRYSDCTVTSQGIWGNSEGYATVALKGTVPDTLDGDDTLSVDVTNYRVYLPYPRTGGSGIVMMYTVGGILVTLSGAVMIENHRGRKRSTAR